MPGSDHGPSIKCPDIYEALLREGYSKTKAAKISNAACRRRGAKTSGEEGDVDVSQAELDEALEKVRAAWRTANPDKDDDEMPEALRVVAAEDDPEPEPKPSRDYLAALWAKIKELAGGSLSKEDFEAAHRSAMGSAGGKAAAKKRAAAKLDAVTAREHAARHPEPVAGCEHCGPYLEHRVVKLPKQDARVDYREADLTLTVAEGDAAQTRMACGNCRFYEWGACALVEGSIEADDVCDLFLPPIQTYLPTPSVYSAAGKGGGWSLFVEQPAAFAEAPAWVNILPQPGAYSHPSYGEITITAERNARFVANFNDRIYQQDLPITIDIEHDGKMSGAVGYIEALRTNEDGSVDAQVAWTERGKTLIEADSFRYVSPEWWDIWREPASGQVYRDVLIGAAICVRPFFKEDALRPLVASEGGLYAPEDPAAGRPVIVMRPLAAREEKPVVVQLTEDEVQAFREAAAERDALRQQVTQLSEAKDASEARIAALEADKRRKKFTDMVRGEGEAGDGAVWPGAINANVEHLIALAEAVGEESEVFTGHVARMQEAAKTLKEASIFSPLGFAESGEESGPWAEVTRLAAAKREADPALTAEQARAQVYRERPDLAEQVS